MNQWIWPALFETDVDFQVPTCSEPVDIYMNLQFTMNAYHINEYGA
jgi:hypothetical protein